MVEFKFKRHYKIHWVSLGATLGYLRIALVQSIEHQAPLPPLSTQLNGSSVDTMKAARTRVRFVEDTPKPLIIQEEPGEAENAPEIPRSSRMLRPKKDKQTMGPARVSPQNPRFSKLLMAEKGKVVTLETEEEEEDLQALIAQIEAQDDEMENISQVPSTIMLPPYIPPWKGKAEIPKNLEAMKSVLQTPLLLDKIRFEDTLMGWVPSIKFEYWDLADNEKFP